MPVRTNRRRPNNWILYLSNGPDGAGMLVLTLVGGVRIKVTLIPSHVRLLYVMIQARLEDQDRLDPDLQGWRQAERLGSAVGRLGREVLPLSRASVVRYIYQIRQQVQRECHGHPLDPGVGEIIESLRGWGYRCRFGIEPVDCNGSDEE